MKLNKGLLKKRLNSLKKAAPIKVKNMHWSLKVFEDSAEASNFHRTEYGEPLDQDAVAFATAWDEGVEEKERSLAFIGIVKNNWPEYADTLEDLDAVLAEEYFHIFHKFQKDNNTYDEDYADYLALTRAIEIGMTPEIASYNIKHIEASAESLKEDKKDGMPIYPSDCINDFARAAALLNGPHRPVYRESAQAIKRRVCEAMENYMSNFSGNLERVMRTYKDTLLSERAYSSSFETERIKNVLTTLAGPVS